MALQEAGIVYRLQLSNQQTIWLHVFVVHSTAISPGQAVVFPQRPQQKPPQQPPQKLPQKLPEQIARPQRVAATSKRPRFMSLSHDRLVTSDAEGSSGNDSSDDDGAPDAPPMPPCNAGLQSHSEEGSIGSTRRHSASKGESVAMREAGHHSRTRPDEPLAAVDTAIDSPVGLKWAVKQRRGHPSAKDKLLEKLPKKVPDQVEASTASLEAVDGLMGSAQPMATSGDNTPSPPADSALKPRAQSSDPLGSRNMKTVDMDIDLDGHHTLHQASMAEGYVQHETAHAAAPRPNVPQVSDNEAALAAGIPQQHHAALRAAAAEPELPVSVRIGPHHGHRIAQQPSNAEATVVRHPRMTQTGPSSGMAEGGSQIPASLRGRAPQAAPHQAAFCAASCEQPSHSGFDQPKAASHAAFHEHPSPHSFHRKVFEQNGQSAQNGHNADSPHHKDGYSKAPGAEASSPQKQSPLQSQQGKLDARLQSASAAWPYSVPFRMPSVPDLRQQRIDPQQQPALADPAKAGMNPPGGANPQEIFRWMNVMRADCAKGCRGPILQSIKRMGRLGRRPVNQIGKLGNMSMTKEAGCLYLSITEACTHVSARCFRSAPCNCLARP